MCDCNFKTKQYDQKIVFSSSMLTSVSQLGKRWDYK